MTFSSNILDRRHPQVTLQPEEELQLTKFLMDRAKPVLTNLLKNAIKYFPLGSTVDLALECRGGEVIFQIKDRGIGIPAAEQQQLFEAFIGVGMSATYQVADWG